MDAQVLDASVVVALFVEEDGTPAAERAIEAAVADDGELHAPDLILYEASNALLKRASRGDIAPELATRLMVDFAGLQIELHPPGSVAGPALGLALSHGITAYDASYLAVCLALGAPLLTLDEGLRAASTAAGISAPRP